MVEVHIDNYRPPTLVAKYYKNMWLSNKQKEEIKTGYTLLADTEYTIRYVIDVYKRQLIRMLFGNCNLQDETV